MFGLLMKAKKIISNKLIIDSRVYRSSVDVAENISGTVCEHLTYVSCDLYQLA